MNLTNMLSPKQFAVLVATLTLVSVPVSEAVAETTVYALNQSNIAPLPDGANYLTLTLTSTVAGTVNFELDPVFAFSKTSNFGIQSFAFNLSGISLPGSSNFVGLPSGWTIDPPPPSSADGFGKFDYIVQTTGSARQASLNFTLNGLGGATTTDTLARFAKLSSGNAGEGNQFFAAHLAGFTAGNQTSAYFAGSTVLPVPEPGTYAMMLAGLGIIAVIARRRM